MTDENSLTDQPPDQLLDAIAEREERVLRLTSSGRTMHVGGGPEVFMIAVAPQVRYRPTAKPVTREHARRLVRVWTPDKWVNAGDVDYSVPAWTAGECCFGAGNRLYPCPGDWTFERGTDTEYVWVTPDGRSALLLREYDHATPVWTFAVDGEERWRTEDDVDAPAVWRRVAEELTPR